MAEPPPQPRDEDGVPIAPSTPPPPPPPSFNGPPGFLIGGSGTQQHAAAVAALLGLAPEPNAAAAARYQALLTPGPAPVDGQAMVRVEYTCVDVSSRYLVCGSNTGVVDIYAHNGAGGHCRLLKALVPPQRSRHTNVKLTCVRLGPRGRMLAVGNILGAVNVVLLDLGEGAAAGGGGRAQRMVHSHAHHQEAVRCLAWDETGTRLYSGCDGGIIVETRLPPATASSTTTTTEQHAPQEASPVSGLGVGSALSLLGSAPLGLGLGSTLASLFQGCSSAVWQREESEIIQLTFHSLAGGKTRLPRGLQRPGDPPADAILLATHARRCNVHLLNRSNPKSLLYSIQVEGGAASAGRTIHGAALAMGHSSSSSDARDDDSSIEYLHLYVSRPQGKFWLLDLGRPNAPVRTLAPALLPPPTDPAAPPPPPPPSLGGRLFLLPISTGPGRRFLLSWTPLGALYLVAVGGDGQGEEQGGGDDGNEGDEAAAGPRAVCLWSRGLHSVALLSPPATDVNDADAAPAPTTATARLVLLHDPDKAVGALELGPRPVFPLPSADAARAERGIMRLQRAWRRRRARALHGELEGLLAAIRAAGARSREEYRRAMRAARAAAAGDGERESSPSPAATEKEGEEEVEEEDAATVAMLADVDAACARARAFVASIQRRGTPPSGAADVTPAAVAAGVADASSGAVGAAAVGAARIDPAAGALVDMVEALLAESRRIVGEGAARGGQWEPAATSAVAAAAAAAASEDEDGQPTVETPEEDQQAAADTGAPPQEEEQQQSSEPPPAEQQQEQEQAQAPPRPVFYRGLARRRDGTGGGGDGDRKTQKQRKARQKKAAATAEAAATPAVSLPPTETEEEEAGVPALPPDDGGVGSAISALAQLQYEVKLVASAGLGLDLAFVGSGVVVRGLAFLPDGRPSPAQLCGRIRPGDALLAVNGVALEPLALKDKLGVLLGLGGRRDAAIALRFMAREASALGRALLPSSGDEAGGDGGGPGSQSPFLPLPEPPRPPASPKPLASGSEEEDEEDEEDDDVAAAAGLSLTEQQRRAMQDKMVELGLLKVPGSGQAPAAPASASMVQQLLSTIVGGGWSARGGAGEGDGQALLLSSPAGSGRGGKRRWGEVGDGAADAAFLGLAQAPEAMERELRAIARDVRALWAAQQRVASGGGEAPSTGDEEDEDARLRRLAAAWLAGQPGRKGGRGRRKGAKHGQQQQRDIAREYQGLLFFKDLLKRSLAEAEAEAAAATAAATATTTMDTTTTAVGGSHSRAGSVPLRRRRHSQELLLGPDEEEGGTSEEEDGEDGGKGANSAPAPLQVYLEAVPLSDVLAELEGAREESEEEEDGGKGAGRGWAERVGEEEAQDLERALQVLSRALDATLQTALEEEAAAAEASEEGVEGVLGVGGLGAGARPWPPIQATHVTGMAVAVQQAHAILGSSETLLQEWLRCFTPLAPDQRHVLQESSSAFLGAHLMVMDREDAAMIAQHHRLTCELITLFFQMHTVWPLLEKPPPPSSSSPATTTNGSSTAAALSPTAATTGAEEVRLRITWGRRPTARGAAARGKLGQQDGDEEEEDDEGGSLDPATGIQRPPKGRGEGRPSQWAEDEAMAFLEEYGAYVVLDGVAQACMARGFARALRWVAQELAPREERFRAAEAALGEALEEVAVGHSEAAAAALVRRVAGRWQRRQGQWGDGDGAGHEAPAEEQEEEDDGEYSPDGGNDSGGGGGDADSAPPPGATLCLALRLLQRAAALPAAAAPTAIAVARELCEALFPHLRPWAARDLLAASGHAEEHHDALLAAVDGAWRWGLAAAMGTENEGAKGERKTAVAVPIVLPPSAPTPLLPSLAEPASLLPGVDQDGAEAEAGAAASVPVLKRALRARLAQLRRAVAAGDVLTAAQAHIWEQAALSAAAAAGAEAGPGSGPGNGAGAGAGADAAALRRPCVLPPLLQTMALVEAAGEGPVEEQEEEGPAEVVMDAVGAMSGDPVEGPGGLGVPLESARRCERLLCGVCRLPCCCDASGGGGATEGDELLGGDGSGGSGGGDAARVVLFACRHAFHARCLPEGACTLCLRAHFAPF